MKQKRSRKKITVLFASLALLAVSFVMGCSYDEPTALANKPVEVHQELYQREIETNMLDERDLAGIADFHRHHAAGPLEVFVTYNPNSKGNSARTATENASRIERILRRHGVSSVSSSILPVKDSDASVSHFSFMAYYARPPQDCDVMRSVDDSEHMNFDDYELGCSVETYLAKQVAKPADLLGRDGIDNPDGRRLGNVVEYQYRFGTPNEPIEGLQASDD